MCVCVCVRARARACVDEMEEVLNDPVPVRSQVMLTGAAKCADAPSPVHARHPSTLGTQFLQCCQLNFKK